MDEEKRTTSKAPAQSSAEKQSSADKQPSAASANVKSRPVQLLICARKVGNLTTMATDTILNALSTYPDISIVRRIRPGALSTLAAGGGGSDDVLVAETSSERAELLKRTAGSNIIVERNYRLQHLGLTQKIAPADVGVPGYALSTASVRIKVTGSDGSPIDGADVYIYAGGFPTPGSTDTLGEVNITIPQAPIDFLYVKPKANFWERWIVRPAIDLTSANSITLQPLSSFAPAGFQQKPFFGWGAKMMSLDVEAANFAGRGAKIGIVDSGCDNTHPALLHVTHGADFTQLDAQGHPDPTSWSQDTVSHGTHCAGIICGNDNNGIRGFAPEAEVHALKLFPGGAFDALISSIKYAIDHQLDVVNCSLGSPDISEAVQMWMERARQAGVAVVVAAGNSSGAVQFPANAPGVLAVGGIGKRGTYPEDTYHAQTVPSGPPGTVSVNGIFAPRFTCFGPEIDVCAPATAIISSVPNGGYAAWDGTSMAAPHVTGLLALIAAHHPAFADKSAPRDAARVDKLFQVLVESATRVGLDMRYSGAGAPNTASALANKANTDFAGTGINPDEFAKFAQSIVRLPVGPQWFPTGSNGARP